MTCYTKSFTGLLTGTLLALALTASPSQAQNAHYLSQDASSCEIFRGLSRRIPMECATQAEIAQFRTLRSFGRTRGLVVYGDDNPATATAAAVPTEAVTPAADETEDLSIAFRAEFEFDSYRLTPDAMAIIDRVATVLKHDLMKDKTIEIQGHADATGTEAYNEALSEKRAYAVKEYLMNRHEIDSSRLKFVGKGESEPYDPSNPEAGVNRRVEFKNIAG